MPSKFNTISKLLLCTALSSGAGYAYAQDDSGDETAARTLSRVTVTAQRKEQDQQDVPVAITTTTAETLEQSGITSTKDLQLVTPGLNVGTQLASSVPFIRGIGTQATASGQDSAVSVYVDDVYLSSSTGSILTLPNIDRVEVLKGPQGTLFGRNATGGLMHVITKTPSADGESNVELSYGNFNTIGASAYLTGGLSENVAADISVYYRDQGDGYGTNLATGNDVNETDELMIRSKWLFDISDATKLTLSADYAETDTSNGVSQRLAPGALGIDGALTFGACLAGGIPMVPADPASCAPVAAAAASQFTGDFQDTNSSADAFTEIEQWGVSGILNHDFGDVELTSVTAYRETEGLQFLTQANINLPGFLDVSLDQFTETFTQEFRLASSYQKLDWIAGIYYLDETAGYAPTRINGLALTPLTDITDDNQQDTTSWAVFAQSDFHLTDATTITAGIRYTEDERTASGTSQGLIGGTTAFSVDYEDSVTFDELTYRLALAHNFTDSFMGYVSYNRGFKSGLYNLNVLSPTGIAPPVEPEVLDAIEAGFKSEFWDNRVRLNAAAFYYDFQDLQVSISSSGANTILNAAEATMSGGEVELLAALTDSFTLSAGLSVLDTEFESFPNGPFFTPNGFGGNTGAVNGSDLSGNQVPRSPEMTISIGGAHELETSFGTITTSARFFHNDGFFWENENRLAQDSYSLVNAGVTWTHPNESFFVRVHGNNLTDEEYSQFGLSSDLGDFISAAPPTTYGVTVGKKF